MLIITNMDLTVLNHLILTPTHQSSCMGSKKRGRPGEGRGCLSRSSSHNTGKDKYFITNSIRHSRLMPTGQGIIYATLQPWYHGGRSGTPSPRPYSWWEEPKQGVTSCWVLFSHRTSRPGSAEGPAVKTVHLEGGPCTAFPPGPTQADLVSASCSGGHSCSFRYLLKEALLDL